MKSNYKEPNFEEFKDSPNARFEKAPADKTLPDGFYSSTNFPTYVKIDNRWVLPKEPRMDAAIVMYDEGIYNREMRAIKKGDLVVCTTSEKGEDGVYVHAKGFPQKEEGDAFAFMGNTSRESPIPYDRIAEIIHENRNGKGHSIWVVGPALVHTKAGKDLSWFVKNGYVGMLTGGNAVPVHDIENNLYNTTLGSDSEGKPISMGHSLHMRAINEVRKAGSIEKLVESGKLTSGIMYSCVKNNIPYIIAGSIRDDGPLPDTITDVLESQIAMREHTKKATNVVVMATALHGIATGNMMPSYYIKDDKVHELPIICVDQTEFIPNKLSDRGTHQAIPVVANVQDVLERIRIRLEKK